MSKAAKKKKAKSAKAARARKPIPKPKPGEVVLLSGGNPQIAKGDGDAPVQAYIAAMPGWKRDIGRQLDALVARAIPDVRKAVKWNSPFYGIAGQGWFLSYHCFSRYVKVTFLPWRLAQAVAAGRVERQERALPRHLRRQAARRSPIRHLGEAGQPPCCTDPSEQKPAWDE